MGDKITWNKFREGFGGSKGVKAFDYYNIIVLSGWYSFFALSVRAFRMRLLNFIHGKIGDLPHFSILLCLTQYIALQTNRPKGRSVTVGKRVGLQNHS